MYKININENTLVLMSSDEYKSSDLSGFGLVAAYTGKSKMLLSYIDMLEKSNRTSKVALYAFDLRQLKKDFESLYRVIRASGGVVEDENGKVLMIFRRGHWDLPKGKIDEGEKKRQAGIREVEEETGIKNPRVLSKLCTTRHSYRLKSGVRALKKTYWFMMKASNQKLKPQVSEDIVEARWAHPGKLLTKDVPVYSNIVDVLKASGHLPS